MIGLFIFVCLLMIIGGLGLRILNILASLIGWLIIAGIILTMVLVAIGWTGLLL